MEGRHTDTVQNESLLTNFTRMQSDWASKFKKMHSQHQLGDSGAQRVAQILWSTGNLAEPIPSGFYSILPEKRLKEKFDMIPSLEELHVLESDGFKLNVIVVDMHKDKKVSMLQQLALTLAKGLTSNPAAVIKKLGGLVCDFYKLPNVELNYAKGAWEEVYNVHNQGIQMLGQIKHGFCHPRAILFKVLADTVGLDCRLMVVTLQSPANHPHPLEITVGTILANALVYHIIRGLPKDGELERTDLHRHVSVIVELNSAELLVDIVRYPGHLVPFSTKAVYMSHVYVIGQGDSGENDSCDSPIEPNSPVHGAVESVDDNIICNSYHLTFLCSLSHGEPNVANAAWGRNKNVLAEQSTPSSRVVRAMNDTLKRNHPPREHIDDHCNSPEHQENASASHRRQTSCPKAFSLPSSPHKYRIHDHGSDRNETEKLEGNLDMITWNKFLESSSIRNEPWFPFHEWNIDFSELTVGSRVGIGFFGEVFRGTWNGIDVAIKVLLEQEITSENIEDFCNEMSILSRLRHPNVILFLGACTTPPHFSLITEYMDMGSLYYLIHVSGLKKRISWRRRLKMLGLMSMHRVKIVHRDLKSANCLVNKHWTVKICDFGLSRVLNTTHIRDCSSAGTPEWMAPELIRNEPFTEKCDIFSFGVIIWELCTLHRPWEGVVRAVGHDGTRLEIPEGPLGNLIADCWAEPYQRPSCEEILSRLMSCEMLI
ncbi:Armadillo repeat-containing protein 3 and Serine/threonine-protein kinase CTR1 [Cynara cardunculus var. scolymus]|uniref:non-specific serine/threonine protein kinase n=1 Tax=Cynara cardunculus var. scolymus TaxID=59895 RepID=A0A103XEW4_CYNCS|nr:Armadillo repeat-containing protein 3 and Serine/threonine-protein kinase CTR1 [Cynara cardunculus var. scolymus]